MSHQVMISYDSLTIKVKSKCETAVHSLCAIDKVLDRIHNTANKLETSKVKEYEEYLLKSKSEITKKIDEFKQYLESLKQKGDNLYNYKITATNINNKANELINFVNNLTGSKLAVIDQMISEGLLDAGKTSAENLLNKINGVVNINQNLIDKINKIEDVSLRELVYQEMVKGSNAGKEYGELLAKAKEQYAALVDNNTKKFVEECKKELRSNGIADDIVDKAQSIDEANSITNEAIADEKIRLETLKVIIAAIRKRGFIVDTKKNLKIDKNRNIVKLVALKASGQTAEFEIHLNGKFMYHFDGYEGSACNKDITPFIDDLKNIYDINILHEEVQWSNPDKIQTKKYQYVNKNKGTN